MPADQFVLTNSGVCRQLSLPQHWLLVPPSNDWNRYNHCRFFRREDTGRSNPDLDTYKFGFRSAAWQSFAKTFFLFGTGVYFPRDTRVGGIDSRLAETKRIDLRRTVSAVGDL